MLSRLFRDFQRESGVLTLDQAKEEALCPTSSILMTALGGGH